MSSNNTSKTNHVALESMSDEGIDYCDIPPLTDEFFERAFLNEQLYGFQRLKLKT